MLSPKSIISVKVQNMYLQLKRQSSLFSFRLSTASTDYRLISRMSTNSLRAIKLSIKCHLISSALTCNRQLSEALVHFYKQMWRKDLRKLGYKTFQKYFNKQVQMVKPNMFFLQVRCSILVYQPSFQLQKFRSMLQKLHMVLQWTYHKDCSGIRQANVVA